MKRLIVFVTVGLVLSVSAGKKSLKDYFLPMEPQGPLVSNGIWGAENVLPRDIRNGLEDPQLKNWCYWDGRIVKDDEGKYHIFSSRWNQKFSHAQGWKENSRATHAVSDHIMGPYVDQGMIWPDWNGGLGHNVIGLRMHDGRYAVVSSDRTPGDVFVSDSPYGPFKHLGEIQVDPNGFEMSLARYSNPKMPAFGHMSNVTLIPRPDGKYMIVCRSTATLISDNGILGPYKIMHDRVYRNYPDLPQSKNEDPTVWYSGSMYHMVYNHWPSKTAYHFTSADGCSNWVYRGIAYKKDAMPFRYPDGTVNDWSFIERPMAYVDPDTGHVTHFTFSVLDVKKGQDRGGDRHGSKIIVVPFDGESFDRDMQALLAKETGGETPP